MTERVLPWLLGPAVVAAALVAGVGPAADQTPPGQPPKKTKATPAKPAPVLKPGEPAAHPLLEADREALRTILRNAVADKAMPGVALLLARRGEVVFKEAFGDLKADKPVQMASDTKPIAATVVLVVVDQGQMRLDDGDQFPGGWPRANTLAEFAVAVAAQGSLQEPGKFRYSSVGIDLACRCAEKAAGRPFEALAREHLWQPLGMRHTRFVGGGNAEAVPKEARERGEGRYVSGGGGLSATLDDMAAFYQMHLNGGRYGDKQILSRKAVVEMHKRQASAPRGMSYGLGFFLVGPSRDGVSRTFQHVGALGTFCWADGSRQLVGVFFSQAGLPKSAPVLVAVQKKVSELVPAGR
jgi:CubicO group peptidase (beta-lactamase class C family)